jgi:Holliday junction resolvasome RuvABC endonuclease subunit
VGNLIDIGYIRLDSKSSVFSRVTDVSSSISDVISGKELDTIFIEENLQAFRPGLSSAKTLLTLARFNGMVSYQMHVLTGKIPVYINVNTARKTLGIKLDRKSSVATKDQIHRWVDNDPAFTNTSSTWPFKILKSGPRKGLEILDPAAYDMADAYVIAKAGIQLFIK